MMQKLKAFLKRLWNVRQYWREAGEEWKEIEPTVRKSIESEHEILKPK
jgi:hypothetical protein